MAATAKLPNCCQDRTRLVTLKGQGGQDRDRLDILDDQAKKESLEQQPTNDSLWWSPVLQVFSDSLNEYLVLTCNFMSRPIPKFLLDIIFCLKLVCG